jgi:hypothetical protein
VSEADDAARHASSIELLSWVGSGYYQVHDGMHGTVSSWDPFHLEVCWAIVIRFVVVVVGNMQAADGGVRSFQLSLFVVISRKSCNDGTGDSI